MSIKFFRRVRFIGPLDDYPELKKNDVGAVIENYEDGNYEVEFSYPPLG